MRRLLSPLALLLLLLVAVPAAASARDASPCGAASARTVHGDRLTTQICPIYVPARIGHVPVVAFPGAREVGRLDAGGSANWFLCQARGPRAAEGPDHNVWWALTLSDDHRRGWVSEVYFHGGGNDEADGGLRRCGAADVRWAKASGAGVPGAAAPTPAPVPAAPPCKPFEILGVRGSGESYAGPYRMGDTVGGSVAAMIHYLPARSVRAFSIPYPAADAGLVASDPNRFFGSMDTGRFLLLAEVHRRVVKCPHVRIAIVGYSQGAGVASEAVRHMAAGDRAHVKALLLWADTYSKGDTDYAYTLRYQGIGGSTRGGHGIFGARSIPLSHPRIIDVCFSVDPVCVSGDTGTTLVNAMFSDVHTQYKSDFAGAWLNIFGRLAAKKVRS